MQTTQRQEAYSRPTAGLQQAYSRPTCVLHSSHMKNVRVLVKISTVIILCFVGDSATFYPMRRQCAAWLSPRLPPLENVRSTFTLNAACRFRHEISCCARDVNECCRRLRPRCVARSTPSTRRANHGDTAGGPRRHGGRTTATWRADHGDMVADHDDMTGGPRRHSGRTTATW